MIAFETVLYSNKYDKDVALHLYIEKDNFGFSVKYNYLRKGATVGGDTLLSNVTLSSAEDKLFDFISGVGVDLDEYEGKFVFSKTTQKTTLNSDARYIVDDATLKIFINDDSYIMQPRVDGFALPFKITGDYCCFYNGDDAPRMHKNNCASDLLFQSNFKELSLYGVQGDDKCFVIYDVISVNDIDRKNRFFDERLKMISSLFEEGDRLSIALAPTAYSRCEKEALIAQSKEKGWRRFVFNHRDNVCNSGGLFSGGFCDAEQAEKILAA